MSKGKGLIVAGIIFMLSSVAGFAAKGAIGGAPFVIGLALVVLGRKKLKEEGGGND